MAISRELLHQIIDSVPDDRVEFIAGKLAEFVVDVDGEPLKPEDVQAIQEAREEFERGESIPLDELLHELNDGEDHHV